MSKNNYQRAMSFIWVGLLMIVALLHIKSAIPDTDTYFLAATGRYIVENGIVPTINPFVIHEGLDVIIQQWGFDVMIYELYDNFGNLGLFAYVTIAYSLMIVLLYRYISLFTKNNWSRSITMLLSGFLFLPFATVRPTSFTILSLLSLLYCVEQYYRTAKVKYLIPLPIISIVQINMHSSLWPIMFVLMIPYLFPHNVYTKKEEMLTALKQWWVRYRWLLLTALIMMGCGFINPNGLNGILYVFKSYGVANQCGIMELQSPTMVSALGILCIAAIILLTAFVASRVRFIKNLNEIYGDVTRFYMAAGTILLACMHLRNIWYLILGVMPIVAMVMDKLPAPPIKSKEESNIKRLAKILGVIALPCLLAIVLAIPTPYSRYSNEDTPLTPKEAVKYLDNFNKDDIKLYNEFNNGAYLEWKGYKVYMDARPELFSIKVNNKEDVLTEYINLTNGELDYREFLQKYQFTHLLVSNKTMTVFMENADDYKVVVEGKGYKLFEKIK